MAKGRNKQGRELKKKKKAKVPGGDVAANVQFRHHAVVTSPPEAPVKPPE